MRRWIVIFEWSTADRETVVVDALTAQAAIHKARSALEADYGSLPFTQYWYEAEAWDIEVLDVPAILRPGE
jgi:hypothetical protein